MIHLSSQRNHSPIRNPLQIEITPEKITQESQSRNYISSQKQFSKPSINSQKQYKYKNKCYFL